MTIDADLAAAAVAAVAQGRVASTSAWVNEALAEKAAKDRRLDAMADAVTAYEADHGIIGPEELAEQTRADRDSAAAARAAAQQRPGAA